MSAFTAILNKEDTLYVSECLDAGTETRLRDWTEIASVYFTIPPPARGCARVAD
jgi:hypothetical protein